MRTGTRRPSTSTTICAGTGGFVGAVGSPSEPGSGAARSGWTEAELHQVQLDTYSRRLLRWRDALLALIPERMDDARADRARALLQAWDGFVDADESAPEILDACRRELRKQVAACVGSDAAGGIGDEALVRMVESRSPHLAPSADGDWRAVAMRTLVGRPVGAGVRHEARDGFQQRREDGFQRRDDGFGRRNEGFGHKAEGFKRKGEGAPRFTEAAGRAPGKTAERRGPNQIRSNGKPAGARAAFKPRSR